MAWQGVRVLICYLATTGARKADVAIDSGVVWGKRAELFGCRLVPVVAPVDGTALGGFFADFYQLSKEKSFQF